MASSASSQGRQAASSAAFGFWWMRRFPRPTHLEVLDRVRDVRERPVDPRRFEPLVEDAAGGADERPPFEIFLVARLLADEDDLG